MNPTSPGFRANVYLAAALLVSVGCATASARKSPPPPPLTPDQVAMERATLAFDLGRDAALAGDLPCATDYFGRAIDTLRPVGSPGEQTREMLAFSQDLYEAILRYEALASPPEELAETAGAEDKIAPELRKIEVPVASEEAMSRAASAVASDTAGAPYDIPIVVNESVLRILAVFQNDLHDVIARGLARSGRYLPMIRKIFEEEGVPKDLAQIAMIESSFLPRARSPKSAHGIWQFMPRTGRQYGLASNAVVDERSDPEKATRAAARHLKYLNTLFHDWYLAMAAYNAGEGKVLKAMARTGFSDFWQLAASGALREQTVSYVPGVIAATLLARNPAHYGFDVEYEKPLEYQTVELKRPVRLKSLSNAQGVPFEDLERLNPELKTGVTPRDPQGYELKVPVGGREAVLAAYAAAPTAVPASYRRHLAKRGETLASIARRFHVPVASLSEINSVGASARLARGRVVLIPTREATRIAARKAPGGASRQRAPVKAVVEANAATRASTSANYLVRVGDTLYRIALKHGTTVALLMAANSLVSPADIHPGDKLTIPFRK